MVKKQSKSKSQSLLPSDSDEFDAVIVGAGAVGSALAIQLGDLGYHVAIVDAYKPNYTSSDPERVIALSHGSKCYLEELGVSLGEAVAGQIQHILLILMPEQIIDLKVLLMMVQICGL